MPGAGLIAWALGYNVDRTRKDVTVTMLGLGAAVPLPRRLGCYLDLVARLPIRRPVCRRKPAQDFWRKSAASLVARNPSFAAARPSFTEPDHPPFAAPRRGGCQKTPASSRNLCRGYGIDTPILGFSATKSVSQLDWNPRAQGALTLDQPAPVAACRRW